MEYLVLLPVIWLIVLLLTKEGGSKKTGSTIKTESAEGMSFDHFAEDFEDKFVVVKSFREKSDRYAIQVKNLQTGELRTVYGTNPTDVSLKVWDVYKEWIA